MNDFETLKKEGIEYNKKKVYATAIDILLKAYSIKNNDNDVNEYLGASYFMTKDYVNAINYLDKMNLENIESSKKFTIFLCKGYSYAFIANNEGANNCVTKMQVIDKNRKEDQNKKELRNGGREGNVGKVEELTTERPEQSVRIGGIVGTAEVKDDSLVKSIAIYVHKGTNIIFCLRRWNPGEVDGQLQIGESGGIDVKIHERRQSGFVGERAVAVIIHVLRGEIDRGISGDPGIQNNVRRIAGRIMPGAIGDLNGKRTAGVVYRIGIKVLGDQCGRLT